MTWRIPYWVVHCNVFFAVSRPQPQRFAKISFVKIDLLFVLAIAMTDLPIGETWSDTDVSFHPHVPSPSLSSVAILTAETILSKLIDSDLSSGGKTLWVAQTLVM